MKILKGLIFMKRRKNVSNREIKNSLLKTLAHNEDAIDYIKNAIYKTENILGYDPSDKQIQEQLNIEKYILFSLEYLEKSYNDSLKKLTTMFVDKEVNDMRWEILNFSSSLTSPAILFLLFSLLPNYYILCNYSFQVYQ